MNKDKNIIDDALDPIFARTSNNFKEVLAFIESKIDIDLDESKGSLENSHNKMSWVVIAMLFRFVFKDKLK